MFVLTANVVIGSFRPFKPHELKWKRDVNNYSDHATIKIPARCNLKAKDGVIYKDVDTGLQITEGMPVKIYAGYNGSNELRFSGFVRRRNFTVPLELECEGYSYQLRKKEGYTKSYASVTVKKLLQDLVQGTDIKLSSKIPDVSLKNVYFKNVKGTDVLEYLKDKCLLTVFFDFDVLYCGLQMADSKATVPFRLGWNVIKDNELKFEIKKELAEVNIQIEARQKTGTKKKVKAQTKGVVAKSVRVLKIRHIDDAASLKKIADEEKAKMIYHGYDGRITAFLIPYVEPSMAAKITDTRYPERTGLYFIEYVESELSPSGGRQKIGIGRALGQ